jgi:hypothetical protein
LSIKRCRMACPQPAVSGWKTLRVIAGKERGEE